MNQTVSSNRVAELQEVWETTFPRTAVHPRQFATWLRNYPYAACVGGIQALRVWCNRTGKHSLPEGLAYVTACMRNIAETIDGELE